MMPGPAILLRDGDSKTTYGWVAAATLDLEMHNSVRPLTDENALSNYRPAARGGTFSGTIA